MRFIVQIILILVMVSTIVICAVKPSMHKAVFVYNSDYKIIAEEKVLTEKVDIPAVEIVVSEAPVNVNRIVNTPVIAKTNDKVRNTVSEMNNMSHNSIPAQRIKAEVNKPQSVEIVNTSQLAVKTTDTRTDNVKKALTQKEEDIAWNVWRSNLQNQIMNDAHLPALPNGIIFRFSFNVDKYGKIRNIYTYSDNPAYTPYAIQYIAPVIRSYQGKSILNFPEGSVRTSTEFKGGWKISASERLSKPQDYNDYEKVIRMTN